MNIESHFLWGEKKNLKCILPPCFGGSLVEGKGQKKI